MGRSTCSVIGLWPFVVGWSSEVRWVSSAISLMSDSPSESGWSILNDSRKFAGVIVWDDTCRDFVVSADILRT
jgi:hypothetical protein